MKLVTFDAGSIGEITSGKPTIALNRQGQISFNKGFVELSGWEAGHMIALHQDAENPEDWYVSLSEEGFELRDYKGSGMLCNSSKLARTFLDSQNIEEKSAKFKIGTETVVVDGVDYWPIITLNPKIGRSRKK